MVASSYPLSDQLNLGLRIPASVDIMYYETGMNDEQDELGRDYMLKLEVYSMTALYV
jgi:hypothetical protein